MSPQFEPDVLRLTNAVLELKDPATDGQVTQLYVQESNGQEFLLSTFSKNNPSTALNLEIDEEDGAKFLVRGPGTVHLTGHLEYYDDDEEEMTEDESPVPMAN